MNSFKKVLLVSTVIGLSACSKKTDYTPPDIKNPKMEDLLKSLKAGGQPGQISLNGAIVKTDGTPDDRVTIEQTVGKSDEQTVISKSQLPKLNPELKRKVDYKPTQFKTYLNVGCDLENDARIEGMTESKNKPNEYGITDTFGPVALMVDKIFICGKVEVKETFPTLDANEVYMDDAELIMKASIGAIAITSNILAIEGKNTVSTAGASDSTAAFLSAASIKLSIYEKISGTGTLVLKSAGGDYVADKAK